VPKCNLLHIMSSQIGLSEAPVSHKGQTDAGFCPISGRHRYFGYFQEGRDKS